MVITKLFEVSVASGNLRSQTELLAASYDIASAGFNSAAEISTILAASIDQAGVTSSTLIGTSIVSNKEIVVNSGAANSTFGSGPGRDFGFDQIVPEEKVGREYIFTRGAGGDSWENYRPTQPTC